MMDAIQFLKSTTNKHSAAKPQPNSLSSAQRRRGSGEEVFEKAPLLNPLPTPASRGEEENSARQNLCELAKLLQIVVRMNTKQNPSNAI
jgi:hypothetical protein